MYKGLHEPVRLIATEICRLTTQRCRKDIPSDLTDILNILETVTNLDMLKIISVKWHTIFAILGPTQLKLK